jgi:hypothetical protein
MRTTVDIPDPIYRELKSQAALKGCSVKELILRGVRAELQNDNAAKKSLRVRLPLIKSKRTGSLQLSNAQVDEILFS